MAEEVMAEAPSQISGAEKSGNLGVLDLAAQLSQGGEAEELASEEQSEEVSETVDELEGVPESDESETETEEDGDVLSQGEQEEELESEEEAEEESEEESEEGQPPKGVQKLLKQVTKLTARAKGAEEERDELKERLDKLESSSGSSEVSSGNTGVSEIDKANTPEQLEKIRQNALAAKKWAMEHLGKDYVEVGEESYDGDDIRRTFRNAEAYLTEYIPQREKHLGQRVESEKLAERDFPVWRGEEEEGLEILQTLQRDKEFMEAPLGKQPAAQYYLGLMYEGMKVVNARQAEAGKGKPKAKRRATPPKVASTGASVPAHDTAHTRKAKKKRSALGDGNITSGQLASFFTD